MPDRTRRRARSQTCSATTGVNWSDCSTSSRRRASSNAAGTPRTADGISSSSPPTASGCCGGCERSHARSRTSSSRHSANPSATSSMPCCFASRRSTSRAARRCSPTDAQQRSTMGKIVVTEFVSLDGVMEAPGGGESYKHGGWTFEIDRGEEGDAFKFDEVMQADAQLLGRVTYEGFAAAWPNYTDKVGFADKMNAMPKYVVSSTLQNADWNNSTILSGDVVAEVKKLRDEVDGVILVAGSARLVQTLLENDLVDELRLMVFPVVLGSGKRLFGETTDKKPLKLADSKIVGDGIAILTYGR